MKKEYKLLKQNAPIIFEKFLRKKIDKLEIELTEYREKYKNGGENEKQEIVKKAEEIKKEIRELTTTYK